MYVTRPRSHYRDYPGALSVVPQSDALYSGHLVVSDDASRPFFFGIRRKGQIKRLPFPQDKILQVVHSSLQEPATDVWFIPVVDQPLSCNRYYIIKAKGPHKGEAYTCSREGETGMCCFNTTAVDPKTRLFDHRDRYQQFEIHNYHSGGFYANSVEWDGYPPSFLRRAGWEVYTSPSSKLHLQQARGLDISNASHFPETNFPLHSKRSTPVVIGMWYCPFVFVKEDNCKIGEQMRECMVYELSLKRWWERIFYAENHVNGGDNVVVVDARVKRVTCFVHGVEGEKGGERDGDGFVWFKVKGCCVRKRSVGLSGGVFEKLRLVQEMRGWFDGEMDVRVFGEKSGENGWVEFGCFVLVESFVLRKMDGSLLINFNFRNTDRIECKWETRGEALVEK